MKEGLKAAKALKEAKKLDKKKPIIIDEYYTLEIDRECGVVLKYDKYTPTEIDGEVKKVHTKDYRYFPTIQQALKRYVSLEIQNSETIDEILSKVEELNRKIDNIDFSFWKN